MNLKKVGLVAGLTLLSTTMGNEESAELPGSEKLLGMKEGMKKNIYEVVVSNTKQKTDSTTYTLGETIQDTNTEFGAVVVARPTQEIEKTPLGMSGVARNFGALLGYNQADSILAKYNKVGEEELTARSKYALLDTLKFPLIYPDLKESFPETLDSLRHEGWLSKFEEKLEGRDTLVIVKNIGDGKQALGFYLDGRLFLATHVSVGTGGRTPTGIYTLQRASARRRSKKYDNAAMPYAIQVVGTNGIFEHQGTVNGKPLSHGCIRVPGLYQEIMYHLIEDNVVMVIDPNLYRKEVRKNSV